MEMDNFLSKLLASAYNTIKTMYSAPPPPLIFWGIQIFLFELSKKGKSAAGRYMTRKISAKTASVGKVTSSCHQPCKGKCQRTPAPGRAPSSTCSLARTHGHGARTVPSPKQLFLRYQEKLFVVCIVSRLLKCWGWNARKHSHRTRELYSRGRWINHGYSIRCIIHTDL